MSCPQIVSNYLKLNDTKGKRVIASKLFPEDIVAKINLMEIASTPEAHERGLQFVRGLPELTGMLFQFKSPRVLSFWMADTYIPLDIAFANKDGVIVKTERMIPLSRRTVSSGGPCTMALEVPAGTFQKAGVKAGDKMTVSQDGKTATIEEE